MKRLVTMAMASAALLSASAADYTVYNNGQLGDGINIYGWWAAGMDFAAADPAGSDTKVYSFKADNGGDAASMGFFCDGTSQYTGPLHSATLNFKWYATTEATYTVRLTANQGAEENYKWTVAADEIGKWNTVSLPVATSYPTVSQQWADFVGKGQGYVFSVVMEGG